MQPRVWIEKLPPLPPPPPKPEPPRVIVIDMGGDPEPEDDGRVVIPMNESDETE